MPYVPRVKRREQLYARQGRSTVRVSNKFQAAREAGEAKAELPLSVSNPFKCGHVVPR
jgi:hypothetical protein